MDIKFLDPINYESIKIGQKYFCAELDDKSCAYFAKWNNQKN